MLTNSPLPAFGRINRYLQVGVPGAHACYSLPDMHLGCSGIVVRIWRLTVTSFSYLQMQISLTHPWRVPLRSYDAMGSLPWLAQTVLLSISYPKR